MEVFGYTIVRDTLPDGTEVETRVGGMALSVERDGRLGESTVTTDEKGDFRTTLDSTGYYTFSSGLPHAIGTPALDFTPLADSGENWAIRSPIVIELTRHIFPDGPVCRRLVRGDDGSQTEMVVFPYNNDTDRPIELPLRFNLLNQLFSPNGDQFPPEFFVVGRSSFSRPLKLFETEGTYGGAWSILTNSLPFTGRPALCTDGGDPDPTPTPDPNEPTPTPTPTPTPEGGDGVCEPTDETAFDRIWQYTSRVVQAQVKQANGLAGRSWKPKPKDRLATFKRGSLVLAALRTLTNLYDDTTTCTTAKRVTAQSCQMVPVDKGAMRALFNKLYVGTPRGLEPLNKKAPQQKEGLEELLSELPDEVYRCDDSGR